MRMLLLAMAVTLAARVAAQSAPPVYLFTTLAGRAGTAGSADGRGEAARFRSPWGVVVDDNGVLFVADAGNATVRRIGVDGTVTTFAGKAGNYGSDDGKGDAARFGRAVPSLASVLTHLSYFNPILFVGPPVLLKPVPMSPRGLAFHPDGRLLVTDSDNSTVRQISPAGEVTTLAGSAAAESAWVDGTGVAARFSTPQGIWADLAGTIFVADTNNEAVRKIEGAAGVVTTWAGHPWLQGVTFNSNTLVIEAPVNGNGVLARFVSPNSLAGAANGDLYVGDFAALRKISAGRAVTTFSGTLTPALVTDPAEVHLPNAMVMDASGLLIIADTFKNRICAITPAGEVFALSAGAADPAGTLGGAADGLGLAASFRRPSGIALDREGNLYIADRGNHTIRKGQRVRPPTIATHPFDRSAIVGQTVSLAVSATSHVPLSYQWRKDGNDVPGGSEAILILADVKLSDAGNYSVVVTNTVGSTTSATVRVTVNAVAAPMALPVFETQPAAVAVLGGQAVTLTASAAGTAPVSYQWFRDGEAVAGATGASLTIAAAQAGDAGSYMVVATNAAGAVTSAPAAVAVNTSRIVNLSIRSTLGPGAPSLTVGFVVKGAGKSLLMRGAGPALTQFGLAGALTDPRLSYFAGARLVGGNDNWSAAPNAAAIVTAAAQVGAFAFSAGSADAAVLTTLDGDGYSAQISGATNGGGVVLVELYDANAQAASRLVNVSARALVGLGDDVLVAGFVVTGNAPKTLVIRAVGPTLAAFGVDGVLADPRLELFHSGATAPDVTNDNWGGGDALGAAFAARGAFPLQAADSRDAALLVTLQPGAYSARVSGVANTTGEALVEIYEVP